MRTPAQILGEHECEEWTSHQWNCAHEAVKAAMTEALEAALESASRHSLYRENKNRCLCNACKSSREIEDLIEQIKQEAQGD